MNFVCQLIDLFLLDTWGFRLEVVLINCDAFHVAARMFAQSKRTCAFLLVVLCQNKTPLFCQSNALVAFRPISWDTYKKCFVDDRLKQSGRFLFRGWAFYAPLYDLLLEIFDCPLVTALGCCLTILIFQKVILARVSLKWIVFIDSTCRLLLFLVWLPNCRSVLSGSDDGMHGWRQ